MRGVAAVNIRAVHIHTGGGQIRFDISAEGVTAAGIDEQASGVGIVGTYGNRGYCVGWGCEGGVRVWGRKTVSGEIKPVTGSHKLNIPLKYRSLYTLILQRPGVGSLKRRRVS